MGTGIGLFGDKSLLATKWPLFSPFSDHRLLTVHEAIKLIGLMSGHHVGLCQSHVISQNQNYQGISLPYTGISLDYTSKKSCVSTHCVCVRASCNLGRHTQTGNILLVMLEHFVHTLCISD